MVEAGDGLGGLQAGDGSLQPGLRVTPRLVLILRISQVTPEFPRPASLNSRCCPFHTPHGSSLVTGRLILFDNTLSLLKENRDFRGEPIQLIAGNGQIWLAQGDAADKSG
jgi:hypothetical protein